MDLVIENMKQLIKEAEKQAKENPELAKKHIKTIKTIGMKTNTKIPREIKRKFCNKCLTFFLPRKNCKIRIKNKKKIIYCNCGARKIIPLKQKI